jgi:hypothetical protein
LGNPFSSLPQGIHLHSRLLSDFPSAHTKHTVVSVFSLSVVQYLAFPVQAMPHISIAKASPLDDVSSSSWETYKTICSCNNCGAVILYWIQKHSSTHGNMMKHLASVHGSTVEVLTCQVAPVKGPKRGPMDNYFLKPAAKKVEKEYSQGTSALHNSLDCQYNDSD